MGSSSCGAAALPEAEVAKAAASCVLCSSSAVRPSTCASSARLPWSSTCSTADPAHNSQHPGPCCAKSSCAAGPTRRLRLPAHVLAEERVHVADLAALVPGHGGLGARQRARGREQVEQRGRRLVGAALAQLADGLHQQHAPLAARQLLGDLLDLRTRRRHRRDAHTPPSCRAKQNRRGSGDEPAPADSLAGRPTAPGAGPNEPPHLALVKRQGLGQLLEQVGGVEVARAV